ncbi:hypothetical protein [Streptomyces sp. NPDC050738]|uniref:hypothetical protein n=1 Tax=Streptomyces sp. NPDC050738 TaxID=3154744 RepID=UPI00341CE284
MTARTGNSGGPKAIVLRIVFALLALGSIGFLAWTAMLRLAIVGRRRRDWALFWAQSALTLVCVGMLESRFADTWIANTGMIVLMVQGVAVFAYFLITDTRLHRSSAQVHAPGLYVPPPAAPAPPAHTGQSIEHRRAELDELAQYLREGGRGR